MPKIEQQRGGKQPRKPKAGAGILDRLGPMPEFDSGIKMAVYGESGTGKTSLWSTFPKPICVAITSGIGMGELRSVKNVPGIEAVELIAEAELPDLVAMVRSSGKYATFVTDHITSLSDLVLKKILNLEEVPVQLAWGTATQSQWGEVGLRMKTLLRDVLSLECNVVLVAQERTFNAEEGLSEVLSPYVNCALSPSVVGWLGPAVDYLVETFLRKQTAEQVIEVSGRQVKTKTETGKVEYCLRTGPNPVYKTKFRLPRGTPLPDVIVDPSYAKIKKLIDGQKSV